MPEVSIGVHVHADPAGFAATLRWLKDNTSPAVHVVVLPDGPDASLAALLRDANLPLLATPDPRGAAACFNRLAASTSADVIVLLESGSLVGPAWLDRLLAALAADPRNGLAGPSTNMAWNEQCVFAAAAVPDAASITARARDAALRFGDNVRSLAPLHSLADFCYAVKREVIEKVGAADEGYGLGPCWEIDYSTRAARAGYRAVWACASYVHRLPFTQRRRRGGALRFQARKQRYQDTFCGLRLRGQRTGPEYEPHCRGDACEHFAPVDLIRIFRPLAATGHAPTATASVPEISLPPVLPKVSCIMPTRGRAAFVRRAMHLFSRQDYPERELIVVDDNAAPDDGLESQLRTHAEVRYVRAPAGSSIGQKRNLACELARGAIFAHWDDDDWFGVHRLSAQVQPILAGRADIIGTHDSV